MVPVGCSYFTVPNRAPAPGEGACMGPPVVWLNGEHDISTDGALARTLAHAIALDATTLIIDLSEVEFMGASTLGIILRARDYLQRRSGSLAVRSASPMARRMIDICGLASLLGLGPSVEKAGTPTRGALGSWVAVPSIQRTLEQPEPSRSALAMASRTTKPAVPLVDQSRAISGPGSVLMGDDAA
jgi:anti-anti-sigma factor